MSKIIVLFVVIASAFGCEKLVWSPPPTEEDQKICAPSAQYWECMRRLGYSRVPVSEARR